MATRRTRSTKPAVPTDDLDDIEDVDVVEEETVEEEAPAPKKARRSKKAAPAPEPEEDEDEEEDEEEEEAPAPKRKKAKAAPKAKAKDDTLGTSWLVEHVNETCDTALTGAALRDLLRKLNKEGKLGEREARSRYTFTGPSDPVVKAVVKAIKNGDLEKAKQEKLEALKAKKASKAKAKAEVIEDDEVEDLDED